MGEIRIIKLYDTYKKVTIYIFIEHISTPHGSLSKHHKTESVYNVFKCAVFSKKYLDFVLQCSCHMFTFYKIISLAFVMWLCNHFYLICTFMYSAYRTYFYIDVSYSLLLMASLHNNKVCLSVWRPKQNLSSGFSMFCFKWCIHLYLFKQQYILKPQLNHEEDFFFPCSLTHDPLHSYTS